CCSADVSRRAAVVRATASHGRRAGRRGVANARAVVGNHLARHPVLIRRRHAVVVIDDATAPRMAAAARGARAGRRPGRDCATLSGGRARDWRAGIRALATPTRSLTPDAARWRVRWRCPGDAARGAAGEKDRFRLARAGLSTD